MAKDNELRNTVLIIGIFTLALFIVDATYKNIGDMFTGPDAWTGVVWGLLHVLIIGGWYVILKHSQDPNKDLFRVILVLLNVGAIILTMAHRAGWIENKQIIENSRPKALKNKTIILDSGEYNSETLSSIIMNSEADTIHIYSTN